MTVLDVGLAAGPSARSNTRKSGRIYFQIMSRKLRAELTGVMAYGPCKDCQTLVEERGGLIGSGVSKKVHYLVVGSVGNEQWRHSTYGTKIMKAMELREAGASIAIVGEDHWQKMLCG